MNISSKQDSKALAEHFFRLEYAKIVSVVTKFFGLNNINLAEDIVQDTLLEAIKSWEYKGLPENPKAWLYTVAKHKSINALKRIKQQSDYKKDYHKGGNSIDIEFSEERIKDDQLRMMFACCHPSISQDAQISLILKTLCGLSIGEIARAFVTSNETINKRLVRARKTLKKEQTRLEIPENEDLNLRLEAILKTVFLLFNEGYSTSKGDKLINYDLCLESIRLIELIHENQQFQKYSSPSALLALMLLNASRFEARTDKSGLMIRLPDQDRSLWDQNLINRGLQHLDKIKDHQEINIYHILAAISAYHCTAKDYLSTNWKGILKMYDALITIDNSPLVKFNRIIALSKVKSTELAIKELLNIESQIPTSYFLFQSVLADMYMEVESFQLALDRLKIALKNAFGKSDKMAISERIALCEKKLR